MKDACGEIGWIGCRNAGPALDAGRFGEKAHWLSRVAGLGLSVPPAFVLDTEAVVRLAEGSTGVLEAGLAELEAATGLALGDPDRPLLLAVRPSAPGGGGGTVPAVLNLGVADATLPALVRQHGERVARDLHRRLIQSLAPVALGVEGEEFEYALYDALKDAGVDSEVELSADALAALSETFLAIAGDHGTGAFPTAARAQLELALSATIEAWHGPRAKARRLARGIDGDAPLALIVQAMALGLGSDPSGAGIAGLRDEATGAKGLTGRYLPQAQGEEALMGLRTPWLLTRAEASGESAGATTLEARAPEAVRALAEAAERIETQLGDAFTFHFTIASGQLHVLETMPARRSARAAIRIAVELAEVGAIDREAALMRIDPAFLEDHLHPTIDPTAERDPIGQGLPASPGAACGELVFSSDAAEDAAAAGRPAILALIETSPEDIRGMHAAHGVLTVRGGMTSHAAVVARSLGRPCVVGAKTLSLDTAAGELRAPDGRVFREGDMLSVIGSDGSVLAGTVRTLQPEVTGAFARLMDWADQTRRMGVRANADSRGEAEVARGFNAAGIGLCRTEHMFFTRGRLAPMRQMIMADSEESRRKALDRLRPMQTEDFIELFEMMAGLPVVIRLLDPPLHEFLPHGEDELAEMAVQLDLPVSRIRARAAELAEFNPMLGKRGCRIGIAFPEIYGMQARAIFEAAIEAAAHTAKAVRPEIMIPLVSAVRELQLLARTIEGVAREIRAERGEMVEYHIGVMIETPRACLRAGEFARECDFLSFGTNDLTQMVYGLSRDDVGRFMPDYVSQGVYEHDPFHSLDPVGVGEMLTIAVERARQAHPGISIGLCGEHGGDPASVAFCDAAGFDYVSCSPYRLPVARLAAAQATIRNR